MANSNTTERVSINGVTVNVPLGRLSFGELRRALGVPTATTLSITPNTQPTTLKGNASYSIVGDEVITSS